MNGDRRQEVLPRRSLLARLSAGATACVAMWAAPARTGVEAAGGATETGAEGAARTSAAAAHAAAGVSSAAADATAWQPARHPEDDWFEVPSVKHRFFLDTAEPAAFGQAIGWARNFLEANATGYHLKDEDSAVVICARHSSTTFAFDHAMWAKYGAELAERTGNLVDPKTKQTPTTNIHLTAAGAGGSGSGGGGTNLDTLIKRGVRLAVCGMSTRRTATLIAEKRGLKVDDVYQELSEHLVPNAKIFPAGILAVSRAQERGYTAATVA